MFSLVLEALESGTVPYSLLLYDILLEALESGTVPYSLLLYYILSCFAGRSVLLFVLRTDAR